MWAPGGWPRASFPEVVTASLLSPEQLSEAVTSQQTGRRPSGPETSSPSFLLPPYPPVFPTTPGSPPAPSRDQCSLSGLTLSRSGVRVWLLRLGVPSSPIISLRRPLPRPLAPAHSLILTYIPTEASRWEPEGRAEISPDSVPLKDPRERERNRNKLGPSRRKTEAKAVVDTDSLWQRQN